MSCNDNQLYGSTTKLQEKPQNRQKYSKTLIFCPLHNFEAWSQKMRRWSRCPRATSEQRLFPDCQIFKNWPKKMSSAHYSNLQTTAKKICDKNVGWLRSPVGSFFAKKNRKNFLILQKISFAKKTKKFFWMKKKSKLDYFKKVDYPAQKNLATFFCETAFGGKGKKYVEHFFHQTFWSSWQFFESFKIKWISFIVSHENKTKIFIKSWMNFSGTSRGGFF